MPTIARLETCTIYIYAEDHNPPHFHVRSRSGDTVILLIEDLSIDEGSVDRRTLKEARDWASENKELLVSKWQEINPE